MPATYTPLLRLTKPGLGDTGWGTTVNDGTTELVDTSVAGTASVDVTSGNVTLTTANGATDQARHMFLRVFGASVARDVIVPATSKLYFVVNECTAAVTVKVSGQTGVAIPASSTAVVRCNGTDVVTSLSYAPSLTLGAALAAASGGTGQASYTTGDLLYATGSTALSKLGIGTNGQILTSTGTAPQWSTLSGVAVTTFSAGTTGFTPNSATSGAVTLAGTLATTNGGTGLTSFTANGVVYASSTSALATGSALTFDGTNLGLSNSAAATVVKIDSSGRYKQFETYQSSVREFYVGYDSTDLVARIFNDNNRPISFGISGSEQMRLTSTGLGIGLGGGSPNAKLSVAGGGIRVSGYSANSAGDGVNVQIGTTGGVNYLQSLNGTGANNLSIDGNQILFRTGAFSDSMTLDSSGNLGLGVTPSAWADMKAMQINAYGSAIAAWNTNRNTYILSNAYYDTSFKFSTTATASAVYYNANGETGVHSWHTAGAAAARTAGNAISFTQAMTLDASGNLSVGTTLTPSQITFAGSSGITYQRSTDNQFGGVLDYLKSRGSAASPTAVQNGDGLFVLRTAPYHGSAYTYLTAQVVEVDGTFTSGQNPPTRVAWYTNEANGSATERARITSTGNVVAGGSVALATTATDGFLYVPTCAGTPTGTPTTQTGTAPIVVDTTNNKLYFYSGGQWRDAGP